MGGGEVVLHNAATMTVITMKNVDNTPLNIPRISGGTPSSGVRRIARVASAQKIVPTPHDLPSYRIGFSQKAQTGLMKIRYVMWAIP